MRLITPIARVPFARSLLSYGASEMASKASRLLVVITVARTMEAGAIGLAAAALAVSDILKALTENGVNQRIIAAPAARLEATCASARRIFTLWCGGLCALQMALGAALALMQDSPVIGALVALLALEYLFMPAGLVQAALAMREGRMHRTAAIAGGQVVCANLASAALALVWPSALALVLPRLLSAPVWLICMRRLRPWRPDPAAGRVPLRHFTGFGARVLAIELVKALRLQADKLLVGALMGPEVLGLYFLAFNAGLGLAQSFSVAMSVVIFPHLARAENRLDALRQGILLSLAGIAPLVILQSLLAPWYVPLMFGPGWQGIAPVVGILCLAAIPMCLWSSAAGWLRAEERTTDELRATALLTLALLINTAVMAPFGLTALAWGYLATAVIGMGAASLPALIAGFGPRAQRT
ncbi:oligosaccharide flippase family protein [Pseudooceanicola sp. CBS1P-1]|uniref:Oligosaccharide flippase family protein n=1 Tax=Pseudooceanicola albus TaxID=2692189 RepID=A0A6L7G2J4_9RHOB|nr:MULTISPECIES: oligosaccharide flippase family protein [Pseudooceanicola]MBT9382260.1 oligosaccharide flippase family protein [Pseudooceanicola endophyticus]MXN16803.1 oligosaccharide flippase family protein [Pseudooceanicola albus]